MPLQAIFLLAILNLSMTSLVSARKIFDLVKSLVFYGRLKLVLHGFSP